MDIETFSNHISRLGKNYFNIACRIVLNDVLGLFAISVDGKDDGGTDFASFDSEGKRQKVSYQITTQKSSIRSKAWNDAKKSIEKLSVSRFYFITTFFLSEVEARKIENDISKDLGISANCYDPKIIAGMLLESNLAYKFLKETDGLITANNIKFAIDYNELALHSYTVLSDDSKKLKDGIYDDTIMFILAKHEDIGNKELQVEFNQIISVEEDIERIIKSRIDSLMVKGKIEKSENDTIHLSEKTKNDFDAREILYKRELSSMVSAQADLLSEYGIEWTLEDSKTISGWIVSAFICDQIESLKELKASVITHPLYSNLDRDGIKKINKYLTDEKHIEYRIAESIVVKIIEMASDHPIITKLTRSAIYLALEGSNPITSAKALGANNWSEFNIIVEPTVAIPFICSCLYEGETDKRFIYALKAIERGKKLDCKLYIPFFYINECAGHLLEARKYIDIEMDPDEIKYSKNAFVSNYYTQKANGKKVPETLLKYLSSFSPAIVSERADQKAWVRSIMTDLQSIINKRGIEFLPVPAYTHDECKELEEAYSYKLRDMHSDKQPILVDHDIYALKYTNDRIVNNSEHWVIICYDKTLIEMGREDKYKGWISNPMKFLDITHTSREMSDAQFVSLLHTVATYSEQTLSIAARIMDRIITYASKEMRGWEFKRDAEEFKKEMMKTVDRVSEEYLYSVDEKVEGFLKSHGISIQNKNDIYE
jgi:hypothetical protein